MHYRAVFLILTIFFAASSLMIAQQADTLPFTASSKSLQFHIDQNFTLSSFQGSSIAYKFHITPVSALRFGVSINGNTGDKDRATQNSSEPQTLDSHYGYKQYQSTTAVELRVQYLLYVPAKYGVSFYYGGGPLTGYYYSKISSSTIDYNSAPPPTLHSETIQKQFSAGCAALAGIEWFASKAISLHAEYGTAFTFSWSKTNNGSTNSTYQSKNTSEEKYNNFSISSENVRFGISVYF